MVTETKTLSGFSAESIEELPNGVITCDPLGCDVEKATNVPETVQATIPGVTKIVWGTSCPLPRLVYKKTTYPGTGWASASAGKGSNIAGKKKCSGNYAIPEVKKPCTCKLCINGFSDLCKNVIKPVKAAPVLEINEVKPKQEMGKGFYPDYWIHQPTRTSILSRDNSKFLGYYDPVQVQDALDEGVIVTKWEYRAHIEDPTTPRRIYVGDDSMIRESELFSKPSPEDQHALVTPYDSDMTEDGNPDIEKDNIWIYTDYCPDYIFAEKQKWVSKLVWDNKRNPYYKWEKVPTITPVACTVHWQNDKIVSPRKTTIVTVKTHKDILRHNTASEILRQKKRADKQAQINAVNARVNNVVAEENRVLVTH